MMSGEKLMQHLRTAVVTMGSQSAAAKRWGISTAYLNDVLRGRREPGEKLLTALGFERCVMYRLRGPKPAGQHKGGYIGDEKPTQ